MREVQAYVCNITFLRDIKQLKEYVLEDCIYDVEQILLSEPDEIVEWASPRWAKKDDIVFFMYSVSSIGLWGHVNKQWEREKDDETDLSKIELIEEYLDIAKSINDYYAGKIFAIGRVVGDIVHDDDCRGEKKHWLRNIYTSIGDINVFDCPVDISEFRDFLCISRSGSITAVVGDAYNKLKELIKKENDIPKYFDESIASEIYLKDIDDSNWIDINFNARKKYLLEMQFREYYVNRFLKTIGDEKQLHFECICHSERSSLARVDNVVKINSKYLPVEVKLNIASEKDITKQVSKYCNLEYIKLKNKNVYPQNLYNNNVLIIDSLNVYMYEYNSNNISHVCDLDSIKNETDILELRNRIIELINKG